MIVVPCNIAKRIKHKILKKIHKIIDGYTVVFSESDGCDEYGYLYWVDCKNGFSGRCYDVSPAQTLAINRFKKISLKMVLFMEAIHTMLMKSSFLKYQKHIE